MLLTIDVGNTNILFGIFTGQQLAAHWRISTPKYQTGDELGLAFTGLLSLAGYSPGQIKAIIFSSVVPALSGPVQRMCLKYFNLEPLAVSAKLDLGLKICYHNPQEIGADRLATAAAGYHKYGRPLIIVDFGTATTFDVINAKGEYLGGCICPGVNLSAEGLFRHTAKLPRVDVVRPAQVIGQDTVTSMQSGLFYGYVAMADGLIGYMEQELGCRPHVVATGGLASLVGESSSKIKTIEPWLILEGLRLIYDRNRPQTA